MFASLKNKIREETGSDLSKLTAKITSSTVQRIDSLRGRSHQGSSSSINSLVSSDGVKEDSSIDTEELKKRLQRIESEFTKKLDQKELEWREILSEKDKRFQSLEKEKEEALKQVHMLRETLKNAEEFKQKLVEHQEDKEQMENFQTQELSKVKHLVLLREQELAEKTASLKEANAQLDKLRTEVSRLRRQEEQLSDLQQNAITEVKVVRKNLENTESELDKSGDECSKLKLSVDSEHEANHSLRQIITKLEKELSEEKTNSLNVQKTLSRVTAEKNTALLRNAEISQQMELVKQEKRRQESEMTDLINKLMQVEDENKKHNEGKVLEQDLRNHVAELEGQISEKNKNIKTLQLRLADMKKTLQQELRTPGNPNYHSDLLENSAAVLTPSQVSTKNFPSVVKRDEDDVNFKYLKHVVIKFLTSREYEAQHLTKAIATLLKFTPDEEKLVNDTLEWKRSWFGSKPKLGSGQKAKAIPHS
jgi:golgin subfamily A protein 1